MCCICAFLPLLTVLTKSETADAGICSGEVEAETESQVKMKTNRGYNLPSLAVLVLPVVEVTSKGTLTPAQCHNYYIRHSHEGCSLTKFFLNVSCTLVLTNGIQSSCYM